MKFSSVEPFHTFIASKFHGDASGLRHRCMDVDINVAIDSLTSEVKLLVSLNEEVSHVLQLQSQ